MGIVVCDIKSAGGSYVWLSNNERKKNVWGARSGARKRDVVRVSTRSRDLVGFVLAGDERVGLGMVHGVWVRCGWWLAIRDVGCGVSSGVWYRGWCQSGHGGGRDWGRCMI